MRYLRSLLKLILAFVLGAVVASFVTLTAASYYAVEHLTLAKPLVAEKNSAKKEPDPEMVPENTWINSNILDVLRVGDQYASELNQFDELKAEVIAHKAPTLCEIICNASSFDQQRMLEERTPYLKDFYQHNGTRALKDPHFQLKLREVGLLSEMFPPAFRSVWLDIERQREADPTFSQKLSWSLKFELAALAEATTLQNKWNKIKLESDRIQGFRDLIQSCQKGLRPLKDLRIECERL